MTGGEVILAVTTIVSVVIAAFALVREWRRDRLKPAVDAADAEQKVADRDQLRATIKQMADETNRARDYRIWQLEAYLDMDRSWHRKMTSLVENLIEALNTELGKSGGHLPDFDIPDPPGIPEPPHG